MRNSIAGALALTLLAAPSAARAQDHIYNLNNTLSDSKGGPSLANVNGTLGANGFAFASGDGLTLTGVVGSTYSIAMRFRFDNVDGYRRMLDFKNRTSDNGPYVLNGASNFYNITTGPTSPYATQQLGLTIFTRDNTGLFSAYFGGALQYSFLDATTEAVPSANIVRFFQDDLAVPNEASGGLVNYIATWNSALTAQQVAAFTPGAPVTTTPEPASFVLLAAGMLAVGVVRARKRTSS
jgi:hypothetical protein